MEHFYICNNLMAGCESHASNPLVRDFILVGQRLARFGFIYNKGDILVLEELD